MYDPLADTEQQQLHRLIKEAKELRRLARAHYKEHDDVESVDEAIFWRNVIEWLETKVK